MSERPNVESMKIHTEFDLARCGEIYKQYRNHADESVRLPIRMAYKLMMGSFATNLDLCEYALALEADNARLQAEYDELLVTSVESTQRWLDAKVKFAKDYALLQNVRDDLRKDNARMQAIVERLPKDALGKTILPGMTVTHSMVGSVVKVLAVGSCTVHFARDDESDLEVGAASMFLITEAAEQAKEKA